MLLGQAAPATPNKPISEMSNDELAAYRRSLGIDDAPALDPNSAVRPGEMAPGSPAPPPAPPAQGGGIGDMLIGWLSSILPGAKDVAPAAPQATPAPIFTGQQAGDAAIAAQKKREQGQQ